MGYRITTLRNLPVGLSCYFFLVGDYRNKNHINDLFRDDFNVIADRIGEDAAIIESTKNGQIEEELTVLLNQYIYKYSKTASFLDRFFMEHPGLLILDRHPDKISDKSLFLYLPFEILEKTYTSTNELISDIVLFAKFKDISIVKKTTKMHPLIKSVSVSLNLGVVSLNFDL
ncbi:MAG: hypothetical protein FWE29_07015 [Defluviitaleaceae bacterium]|nr:hypothetical protein [Defluviitaleaceae bacterium]